MKGSIYGKRKWLGLWGISAMIIVYSIIAKFMGIDPDTTGRVIWGMVSMFAAYVTGNAIAKFNKTSQR